MGSGSSVAPEGAFETGSLATIDENLIRNELTQLERAEALARRKEIYEALYPEARDDSSERMRLVRRSETVSLRHPAFAADTAAKTGLTPRTIQQDVQIATKIVPDVRDAIQDTPLAASSSPATRWQQAFSRTRRP